MNIFLIKNNKKKLCIAKAIIEEKKIDIKI